ncbi:LCP family protein [Amycolatopsis saalfeldensis]|uniref:Cell envelope-related function transcriptional attenuator common domain-containing protein n=1 Tax=Amycolatopsis saalfeldensis TaxID=394193 RepID=A0A1H8XY63_9PSEU|nr:LCP family protein [Amycolatopsis saalfeldensis]SEP44248.1 cell envelope-related function transcriptional attenuator common domain-containing protein [Amycolatopsis saalfeldensis]
MTYGGDGGRRQEPPRRPQPPGSPRQHQRAQMMPLPGSAPSAYDQRTRPMGNRGEAPPPGPPPRQDPPGPHEGGPAPRPRRRRRWSIGKILMTLVLIFVLFIGGIWAYLEFSITRVDALADYDGRPAAASGTNWLVVGSDSRAGLSAAEEENLATGDTSDASGQRTDTIMVAHIPDNSTKPTLLSLPRDSEVKIPGHGTSKINAAYALGGPALLVKTVEGVTGLRIDHYAEIGFGGFATIVDAIGGVDMCVDKDMNDTMTGINIKAGCQTLDGRDSLGFVRMRHSVATPRSDLDRVANQRKFIGALVSQIASPGTLLNPFHFFPLLSSAPAALTMDSGDHVHNLAGLAIAMRGISSGGVLTGTVPVTDGSATHWDKAKSTQLFDALKNDTAVPDGILIS